MKFFTPLGKSRALSIDPQGRGHLPVVEKAGRFCAERVDRHFRYRVERLPNGQGPDEASLFLAEVLIGVRKDGRKDAAGAIGFAPLFLRPVAQTSEGVFEQTGPRVSNDELLRALKPRGVELRTVHGARPFHDPKNAIASIDRSFKAVVILPATERIKKRMVAGPAARAAPALRRLLGEDAVHGHAPFTGPASFAIDLDVDQRAVLAAVQNGFDVLITGPPGTGKSRLVAAIARCALHAGRRVLVGASIGFALDVLRPALAEFADHPGLAICSPDELAARPAIEPLFDVTLIDEASLMMRAELILYATRSRQMIVCGDGAQLPPPGGGPSAFAFAASCGYDHHRLKQHYRSRSESLFWPSNAAAYGRAIRTAPRPDALVSDCGFELYLPVRAQLERTRAGIVNRTEADLVSTRLIEIARSKPARSVAVLTTTTAQCEAIAAEVTRRFQQQGMDTGALDVGEERFFVRNTDFQGFERDIVLLSFAYSPDPDGHLDFANFERLAPPERLNVMVSRARRRTEIFASFTPAHVFRQGQVTLAGSAFAETLLNVMQLLSFDLSHPPSKRIRETLALVERHVGLVVNLGAVFGVTGRDSDRFLLGIVYRDARMSEMEWDATIAQLEALEWSLAVLTPSDIADMEMAERYVASMFKTARARFQDRPTAA